MFDFQLAPFTKDTATPCTLDPRLFDPWDESESLDQFRTRTREARNRCNHCPVLFQCKSWTRDIQPGEVTGVLAGKDELARHNDRMTAKRRRVAVEQPNAKDAASILYTPAEERRLVLPSMLAAGMTVAEIAKACEVGEERIYNDLKVNGYPLPTEIAATVLAAA